MTVTKGTFGRENMQSFSYYANVTVLFFMQYYLPLKQVNKFASLTQ